MMFEVRPNVERKRKLLFGQVLCVLMILGILWLLNWDFMADYLKGEPGTYWLFVGFLLLFILLFLLTFYMRSHPRICVKEQDVTFYLLFRPAKRVAWSEIKRKSEADRTYRATGGAVATMAGGVIGYTIYKKAVGIDPNALLGTYPRQYTYYQGDKKLIVICAREMENADQFDRLVQEYLAKGTLNTDLESSTQGVISDKTRKSPLVFVGAFMAIFVLAVVVFVVSPEVLKLQSGTTDPGATPPAGTEQELPVNGITHSTQGVAFTVSTGWTQMDGSDLFATENRKEVYGLNGVSALGSYLPQEFYKNLVEYYKTSNQFTELDAPEELTSWISDDGVACQIADLTGHKDSVIYCTKLVIAPQKNMVLTFCGQAHENTCEPSDVWRSLNLLCDSLTFETGNQDYISGNTFLCGDGSQVCLQNDGSYRYYQSEDNHENQYYEGVYEVYYGQAAVDKVASMTEYGLTEEELEQVLSANMNGYVPGGSTPSDYLYYEGILEDNRERYMVCLDTFYAVILHNQRLVYSPENVREGGNSTLYIGFYIPELEMADLTNCNALSNTQWTFQSETN